MFVCGAITMMLYSLWIQVHITTSTFYEVFEVCHNVINFSLWSYKKSYNEVRVLILTQMFNGSFKIAVKLP